MTPAPLPPSGPRWDNWWDKLAYEPSRQSKSSRSVRWSAKKAHKARGVGGKKRQIPSKSALWFRKKLRQQQHRAQGIISVTKTTVLRSSKDYVEEDTIVAEGPEPETIEDAAAITAQLENDSAAAVRPTTTGTLDANGNVNPGDSIHIKIRIRLATASGQE